MTSKTTTKVHGFRVTETGGPQVLTYGDIELPSPGPGQALVRLHAAGVNFLDVGQRRGTYPTKLPFTPGVEASGVVEQVGADVCAVKPGDRVCYTGGPGSYAEANIVKAESLIPLPADLDFVEGAAFPLQGMTAHYLLHEFRKIKRGDVVLIHAAAGGMGLLLVQWAKHLGARVLGTVSTEEKAKIAREAGADDVIIYTRQDFVAESKRLTNDRGPDLIIDGVGKDTFSKNLEAIALRGTAVIFGAASGMAEPVMPNSLMQKSVTICGGSLFNYLLDREELMMRANDVLKGLKEGWLKLRVEHVLPLREAAKAHELLENRQTVGKIVLKCRED
jgi:NADPH2:quinone reductase